MSDEVSKEGNMRKNGQAVFDSDLPTSIDHLVFEITKTEPNSGHSASNNVGFKEVLIEGTIEDVIMGDE
jgi:hypothetical protein